MSYDTSNTARASVRHEFNVHLIVVNFCASAKLAKICCKLMIAEHLKSITKPSKTMKYKQLNEAAANY